MIDRIPSPKAVTAAAYASAKTNEAASAKPIKQPILAGSASLPQLINLARTLAESGPPIDSAKIARVRQAIADGNYRVDVEALANAMLLYSGAAKE